MNKSQQYDIFISYRREGGYDTAQLLYDRLTQMGYRVSFDLETLRGGKFNTQLYRRIEQCSDVLVVMSRDSLNLRDNQEDDWFRLEIAHALKHKKNIVPVFLRDFKFPQKGELPEDMADLVDYQGVTASQEHFDSVLNRICRNFKAKPRRRKWPVVAAIAAALLVGAGIGVWLKADKIFPYPFTREARQAVDAYYGTVLRIGAAYNEFLSAKMELLDKVSLSIESEDKAPYQAAVPEFLHRRGMARKNLDAAAEALERVVKENPGLRVDRAYIPNFLEGVRQEFGDADEWAALFKLPCDPDYACSKANRIRIVMLNRKEIEIYADVFAYGVMFLFDMISPEALADFREVAAKQWTMLKRFRGEWLSDQKQIEQNGEASLNQLQEVVEELAQIIGNTAQALEQAKRNTKQMRIDAGMSPEQAERIGKKEEELENLKAQRKETQKAIADTRERIRKKFAPNDDDDVGMLWGKALRFMSVNMPEDAKLCIDALRRRNTSEFPPVALDAAEAIFLSKEPLPFVDGVLVCAYEPPATSHAIFKVGDVITKVNEKPCRRYEDYRNKAGNTYTIYRRNAKGQFDKLTATMPEGQPRVALVDLTEKGSGK